MDEHERCSLEQAKYFLHLKDYLFYKLTGEITTDATDQSLVLINQDTRTYMDALFELCGIAAYREKYPPIKSAQDNAAYILPQVAKTLGLSVDIDTVVTSGPMDVAACALGSGVMEVGECCSIIGTAALHEMVVDKPLQDDICAGMTVTHVMEGRWLRLMASLAGTPNLEWMLSTVGCRINMEAQDAGEDVFARMEHLIADISIGSNGVMYHPYLLTGGERAPFTEPRARASYTGLGVRNTVADIVRATYEGVAFAMLDCYRSMPALPKKVTVCGGGARSGIWCQMFADVLGTEVVTVKGVELGAKGVVINNAVVQGFYAGYPEAVKETVKPDKRYMPDMKRHKTYAQFYELYDLTRRQMQDTWKLRASLLNL
jgi:sugar (pentulose or hexulose) kinase